MQLKSLRLFMAVAETGSFIAAAKQLHTVQSNVTTHIKKLEKELGAQLVHRTGGVRLTSAGQALLDYAKRMLATHDEALALFKSQESASGQLRLGAMETTMALRLPPILAAYHASYPEVDMTLSTGPTATLIEQLMAGQVDGVFVAGGIDHHRYRSLNVFSEQLVLVSSIPMTSIPSSEELLSATFLAFRQGCSYRQRIELLLASQGINAVRVWHVRRHAWLRCGRNGLHSTATRHRCGAPAPLWYSLYGTALLHCQYRYLFCYIRTRHLVTRSSPFHRNLTHKSIGGLTTT